MEGKKSFLLYCDIINTVNLLDDNQAGKLFKHLLQYVNDQDPELEDQMLKIAFEPIKQSLKRDLKRYKNISEKRREAGRLGGQKRASNLAKQANATNVKQNQANQADIDSDSDSDSDIDKKSKPKKGRSALPPNFSEFEEYALLKSVDKGLELDPAKLKLKYESWVANNWRTGKDRKITNWKTTLLNTLPFLKKEKSSGQKEKKTGSQEWRELIEQPQSN